jgi:nitrate/nitrite transport system ATP-binding protein
MQTNKSFLQVQNLSKSYSLDGPPVFEGINFEIQKGEFICIIGHSGCGKTTILNVLAGLEKASSGYAFMLEREIKGPGLERGVVFQGHALMPWMTVLENVSFAVKSKFPDWSKSKIEEHANKYLTLVGLSGANQKKPSELSGGMKQRVGIARAFAIEPQMLLLDEPFGALDALTRGVIQDELLKICKETKQTVFMITHDVDEAILLSDRILLMSNGPNAKIAEIVVNTLPKNRQRATLHHDAKYYPVRNHLVDFLVNRSKKLQSESSQEMTTHHFEPLIVYPGLEESSTFN